MKQVLDTLTKFDIIIIYHRERKNNLPSRTPSAWPKKKDSRGSMNSRSEWKMREGKENRGNKRKGKDVENKKSKKTDSWRKL